MYLSRFALTFQVRDNKWVLFNPLSGSLDIVDEDIMNTINKIKNKHNILDFLYKRGYIFRSKFDEGSLTLKLYEQYNKMIQENKLLDIVIIPTYACNLRCTYCFESDIPRKSEYIKDTHLDKIFNAVDELSKEYKRGPQITLFGGEPLLKQARPIVKRILKRCSEFEYPAYIVTNGVHLSDYVPIISNSTVKSVHITIDGSKHYHDKRRIFASGRGTYDMITESIDVFLKEIDDIDLFVRTNLDEENISSIVELSRFYHSKNWQLCKNFKPYLAYARSGECEGFDVALPPAEVLQRVFKIRDKNPETQIFRLTGWFPVRTLLRVIEKGIPEFPRFQYCSANIDEYCFDPYGDIYPCDQIIGRKEYLIGKYYPELQIYENKLRKWRISIFDFVKCQQCNLALLCGGGCTFQTAIKKDPSLQQRYCEEIKPILEVAIKNFFPILQERATLNK